MKISAGALPFAAPCKQQGAETFNSIIYFSDHPGAHDMKKKTHKRMTRILFPDLDPRMIECVNKKMDTPQPWMPAYSPKLGRVPGLAHSGHRKYGHDLFTAGIIGISEGRSEGLAAAWMHLLQDAARDQVVKASGEDGANLCEDLFNLAYGHLNKRSRTRTKEKRRKKIS
jgi:hypothetical protein